eukprot:TRINITY_DN32049_c0_g1_i1.p1 TRINITY_DN32049_c0_g1~~TRINITY_DN32049_c0_g1_i1.p1  ORF type:complete len:403 (+),score=136.52 TRINITY_DN32049_c0_g1_i1:117-1325(+)
MTEALCSADATRAGGWTGPGGSICYLAGPSAAAALEVPAPLGPGEPRIKSGDFHFVKCKDWAAAQGVQGLELQMGNKVKKCECGKPNAFTLKLCNSCGKTLPEEPTTTPNVFMCFVYGFEGLKLSLRYEDTSMMVIDDMLSLSPAHLNAVWTREWIPDFRWLFARPQQGLETVKTMRGHCDAVFRSQFGGKGYKEKFLVGADGVDLADLVVSGYNFPPSQYQLHLQYIAVPWVPFQYAQYLRGVHCTKERFFPYEYVLRGLTALVEARKCLVIEDDSDAEYIIRKLREVGVDYDAMWTEIVQVGLKEKQEKYANWRHTDFSHAAVDSAKHTLSVKAGGVHAEGAGEPLGSTNDDDKAVLQSYGRPYKDGKPNASAWYGLAKKPGEVVFFPDAHALEAGFTRL